MYFTWHVEQLPDTDTTLYVTLRTDLEMQISDVQVYNMVGFKDASKGNMWDYLACKVQYDGKVNANAISRSF